ncbi:MAG TPA: hypothetical protein VHG28_20435 [Longimicrobiaceae bacterium]|nr:hypothetical protein [Longimicrobiaceae bacterium]
MREKLPELALEAASVVFAVLLALAVDEWRENRSRRELAERARIAILQEVRANRAELTETRRDHVALMARLGTRTRQPGSDSSVALEVNFSISLLTSAAWQTAQVTQAVHLLDYDWTSRVARLYELQALYNETQRRLADRITDLGDLAGSDPQPQRIIELVRTPLQVVIRLEDALIGEYSALLRGGGSAGRAGPR